FRSVRAGMDRGVLIGTGAGGTGTVRLSGNGCVGTDRGGVDARRAGDGDGGCLSWNAGDSNFRKAGAATARPVRRVCRWRCSGIVGEPLAAENFDLRK